ncbi:Hypothetical_protein [Hexamita inflata]|uniref:Hypothetical_protein n=1 Tax=Hexamita inflata TaxID=28002 RepID=A0AA86RI81_9EUKA|nr:Hypothetical protein HINF_LOCUS61628 [Hexamita inflata]
MHHHGGPHHGSHTVHHSSHPYSSQYNTGAQYASGTRNKAEDPLFLFQNPTCWRVMSWIVLTVICVGFALIISYAVSSRDSFGMLIGGAVLLMYSFGLGVVTSIKCCTLGSFRFIMCPCLMNQIELDALKNRCQKSHDARYGVVQQIDLNGGIMNQVQMSSYLQRQENGAQQNVEVRRQPHVQNSIQLGDNVNGDNTFVYTQKEGQIQNGFKHTDLVIEAVM